MNAKWTADELAEMVNGLMLESTIGKRAGVGESRTFQTSGARLPLVSLRKCLRYGFQRWINDRVGGDDMALPDKIKDTEIFLAAVEDGSWVRTMRVRSEASIETKIGRDVVKRAILAQDGTALNGLKGDDLATRLDDVLAKNEALFAPEIAAEIVAAKRKSVAVAKIAASIKL